MTDNAERVAPKVYMTGRLETSDLWHKVSLRGDGSAGVVLLCTGHTVQRSRVILDSLGINVTCLRCQRKVQHNDGSA